MSKQIRAISVSKSDFLLKNWNIYHLHLEKDTAVSYTHLDVYKRQCLSDEHQQMNITSFPTSACVLDAMINDAVKNGVHYYEYEYELDEADACLLYTSTVTSL